MFKKIIALLLLTTQVANAGLPPTSTKASGDANFFTTFQFEFPNFTRTRSGIKTTFNILGAQGGGTGFGSFAVGDMFYADTTTTIAKIAACADGYVHKYSSGIPTCQPDNGNFAATDWASFTSTIAGAGTISNQSSWWRRIGDSMEIWLNFTTGTATGAAATATLPSVCGSGSSACSINTAKSPTAFNPIIGNAIMQGPTSREVTVLFKPSDATKMYFGVHVDGTTSGLTDNVGTTIWNDNSNVSYIIKVPISGWSGSTVGDASYRAVITNNGTAAISSQGPVTWLSSVTRNATGDVTLNLTGTPFSANPACAITAKTNNVCAFYNGTLPGTSTITTKMQTCNGAASIDNDFTIICQGPK